MTAQPIPHTAVPNTARVRRLLSAPPERVFDVFLEPGCIRRWFGAGAGTVRSLEIDPQVGGRFFVAVRRTSGAELETYGVYRELDRPRRLVFTWTTPIADRAHGVVTVEIAPHDGGSTVTLTHQLDHCSRGHRLDIEVGWQHMLDAMADALAGSIRDRERGSS